MPYRLTDADIMDLRASVRWRLTDPIASAGVPFICFAAEDAMAMNAPGYSPDAFALHTQGHLRAVSCRLEILAECLRQEHARPGFVSDILNPRVDCTVAALDPAEAAAKRSRLAFEAKAAREFAAAEALHRKALRPTPKSVDLPTISFDD